MTDLTELIARMEALTEPSREVDAMIWTATPGHETHFPNPYVHEDDSIRAFTAPIEGMGPMNRWQRVPALTASLDAIVALVEAKLPDCSWYVEREHFYDNGTIRYRYIARVRAPQSPRIHVKASFANASIALTAALLRAIAQEDGGK